MNRAQVSHILDKYVTRQVESKVTYRTDGAMIEITCQARNGEHVATRDVKIRPVEWEPKKLLDEINQLLGMCFVELNELNNGRIMGVVYANLRNDVVPESRMIEL